jgi:hypothetical protein
MDYSNDADYREQDNRRSWIVHNGNVAEWLNAFAVSESPSSRQGFVPDF